MQAVWGRKGKRKVFSKSCSEMRNNSKKFFTKDANSRIFGAKLRKQAQTLFLFFGGCVKILLRNYGQPATRGLHNNNIL
jgi:hypothetical protein